MAQPGTWRDLLAEIIQDPREKLRIAAALRINPVTPSRWANNLSRPRSQYHKKLLDAIPAQHKQEFAELFALDFPVSSEPIIDDEQNEEPVDEIPSPFYARIFSAYTSIPHELRLMSILSLILQQMLSHLDSDQEGISISVAICTTPLDGQPVRTLHEFTGRGTPPFKGHLEMQPFFLGIGSMAAFAVTHSRQLVIQNLREDTGFAHFLRTDYEESAMVYPILFENGIAGCSIGTSYFYKPSQIDLRVLPEPQKQHKFFANYPQRLIANITRLAGQGVTRLEAEAITLREIEDEILLQNNF